jgi:hypothetical protein
MNDKKWCAMCGKWGDHQSGTCPELHPSAEGSSEVAAPPSALAAGTGSTCLENAIANVTQRHTIRLANRVTLRHNYGVMKNTTKTRNTFDGRPVQIIWRDQANGKVRFQYRPDKTDDTMRVLTVSLDDARFGWSNAELDTLED